MPGRRSFEEQEGLEMAGVVRIVKGELLRRIVVGFRRVLALRVGF